MHGGAGEPGDVLVGSREGFEAVAFYFADVWRKGFAALGHDLAHADGADVDDKLAGVEDVAGAVLVDKLVALLFGREAEHDERWLCGNAVEVGERGGVENGTGAV